MTLIAVMSAKGAPGVTTLTVALAALGGPDAVAADLDPYGGDLALRYRRDDGRPLDPDVGLLSLAATIRRGGRDLARDGAVLGDHLQRASGGLAVLAGISRPEQVAGLGPLWRHVALALASNGTVFADCGRVGPSSAVLPVLTSADAVLVVARAELEELAHLRERLRFLTGLMPSAAATRTRIGVVLITTERDSAATGRAQRLLASAGLNVPVIGRIADDPKGAAVMRGVRAGRPGRTLLVRSARSLLPAVLSLAGGPLRAEKGPARRPEPPAPAAQLAEPSASVFSPAPAMPGTSTPPGAPSVKERPSRRSGRPAASDRREPPPAARGAALNGFEHPAHRDREH
jgi:MinD-like ATPase involved in chromosome partitioning or flagellar assembly